MSAWARALYRRTSLPVRIAFNLAAWMRSRRKPTYLTLPGDRYLASQTAYTVGHHWEFGFHRVWDLVRHLDTGGTRRSLRVLSLGPRTEIELYYLSFLFDFRWDHIEAVDVVSWNPKVRLGDMSVSLPFEDDRFDVIVACHSLEKSRNPEITRNEIFRVAKRNAQIVVGGDRVAEGDPLVTELPIPYRFFDAGVYGFITTYGLALRDIEYMNARSPHGFEIIFRVKK